MLTYTFGRRLELRESFTASWRVNSLLTLIRMLPVAVEPSWMLFVPDWRVPVRSRVVAVRVVPTMNSNAVLDMNWQTPAELVKPMTDFEELLRVTWMLEAAMLLPVVTSETVTLTVASG